MKKSSFMLRFFVCVCLLIMSAIAPATWQSGSVSASEAVPPLEQILWQASDCEELTAENSFVKDALATITGEGDDRKVVVQTGTDYPWPGVTFQGQWSLPRFNRITAEVVNLEKEKTIFLNCRVDDKDSIQNGSWQTSTVTVLPGEKKTITVWLPANAPAYIAEKVFGMRGVPGELPTSYETGRVESDKAFDRESINAVWVFSSNQKEPVRFAVIRIEAQSAGLPVADWITMTEDEFFPMIDSFGQFKHADWSGKIESEQQLRDNIEIEANDLLAHPAPADRNEYGGWKSGPQLESTGHFRTEKYRDKWWLVDPSGSLFWSHGVDCVHPGQSTAITDREYLYESLPDPQSPLAAFYATTSGAPHGYYREKKNYRLYDHALANLYRKYGDDWRTAFSALAHQRIRSWGMNTIANWSDYRIYEMRQTPYTVTCGTGNYHIEGSAGYWGKFPDPFHPGFRKALRNELSHQQRFLDDPWCIGVFVNNEISWGDETSLSEAALISPPESHSKIAFCNWLEQKYETIELLNESWKTHFADRDDLLAVKELPADRNINDMKEFYSVIAEEYFKVIHEEIKATSPNKLDLGCRFAWGNNLAVLASAKYVDVISFNIYALSPNELKLPEGIDKPCIIGEFHFGALDRGMFHTGLVPTINQNDRAAKYESYLRDALENPFLVGTHWFQYVSQSTTGRTDGENYQIGFLDICDTPYPETIEATRKIGHLLYSLRSGNQK